MEYELQTQLTQVFFKMLNQCVWVFYLLSFVFLLLTSYIFAFLLVLGLLYKRNRTCRSNRSDTDNSVETSLFWFHLSNVRVCCFNWATLD